MLKRYHRFVKPQKGNIVIDAGAHVGVYTIEVAKAVGNEGRVIAIEPDPDNFRMLKFHIALNRLNNVVALRLALGSRIGKTQLFRLGPPHNVISDVATSTLLKQKTLVKCRVHIVTLDFLCCKLKVKNVDILKLDVEGAEVEVLKA